MHVMTKRTCSCSRESVPTFSRGGVASLRSRSGRPTALPSFICVSGLAGTRPKIVKKKNRNVLHHNTEGDMWYEITSSILSSLSFLIITCVSSMMGRNLSEYVCLYQMFPITFWCVIFFFFSILMIFSYFRFLTEVAIFFSSSSIISPFVSVSLICTLVLNIILVLFLSVFKPTAAGKRSYLALEDAYVYMEKKNAETEKTLKTYSE